MKDILAEIITIGDEILYGQIVDTNSQWISKHLDKVGIKVIRKTTIGDSEQQILTSIKEVQNRTDILLITGGLGPTNDDLTKSSLVKYFNTKLVLNKTALKNISAIFNPSGKPVKKVHRQQAELPEGCEMIPNNIGTAAGMWFNKNSKVLISMPGVPYEMKDMMTNFVIPKLQEKYKTPIIYHKVVNTVGIGESNLAEMITDWEHYLPENIKLAYLPGLAQVKLRLTVFGSVKKQIEREIEEQIGKLKKLAGKHIYGYDEEQLEEVLGQLLKKNNLNLAVAEIGTGGYISHLMTSIAGSEEYFRGGITPYQKNTSINVLEINSETISQHGQASEQIAIEMAESVRNLYHADCGLATSGIAYFRESLLKKPVATIWIAVADGKETATQKLQLWKTQELNIKTTATAILNMTRLKLLKK